MSIIDLFKRARTSVAESVHPSFNAKNMHLLTEYDSIVSDDSKRLDAFKRRLEDFVNTKARIGQNTCTYDIPEDLRHLSHEIISWLEGAGFAVIDEGKFHPAFEGTIGISWRQYIVSTREQ